MLESIGLTHRRHLDLRSAFADHSTAGRPQIATKPGDVHAKHSEWHSDVEARLRKAAWL